MKKLSIILLASLLLFLSGCIPSLHPLYSPDTLHFEKGLLGIWHEEDGGTWNFIANPDRSYRVQFVDEDKEQDSLIVHLVKLDDQLFLDFVRPEREEYFAPYLPTHSFAKIEKSGNNWVIRQFKGEYLKNLIKNRKIRIKHEVLNDDNYLLTASTEELQEFFRKFAHEEEAFEQPAVLTREM